MRSKRSAWIRRKESIGRLLGRTIGGFSVLGLALVILVSAGFVLSATNYRINTGLSNQTVDEWGNCRRVTNASGRDIFIPTRTSNEWTSFLNNLPSGLTVSDCVATLTWWGSSAGSQAMSSGQMKYFTAGTYGLRVDRAVTLNLGGAAGGGGGREYYCTNSGGGGGGGASTNFQSSVTLDPARTYTLVVGAGGAGGYAGGDTILQNELGTIHLWLQGGQTPAYPTCDYGAGTYGYGGAPLAGTGIAGGAGGQGVYIYEAGRAGQSIANGTGGGGSAGGSCDWGVNGSGGAGGYGGNGVTGGGAPWNNGSGYTGQNGGCWGVGAFGNTHYESPGGGGGGWTTAGLPGSYGGGGGGSTTGYSNPAGGAGGNGVFVFRAP